MKKFLKNTTGIGCSFFLFFLIQSCEVNKPTSTSVLERKITFSFHGVEKMKNHSQFREFIYGGFTLLNKKNPYIDKNNKVATEFHLYD